MSDHAEIVVKRTAKRLIEKKWPNAAAIHLCLDGMGETDPVHQWPIGGITDEVGWGQDVLDTARDYATSLLAPCDFTLRVLDEKMQQIGKVLFRMQPLVDEKGVSGIAYSGSATDVVRQSMNHLETAHRRNNQVMNFLFTEVRSMLQLQGDMLRESMADRRRFYDEVIAREAEIAQSAAQNALDGQGDIVEKLLDKTERFAPLILQALNNKNRD